jgi:polyhydroxybutyrate depolymerase
MSQTPTGDSGRGTGGRQTGALGRVATAATAVVAVLLLGACESDGEPAAPSSEVASPGDSAPATPHSGERQVTVDGTQRRYHVVIPPGETSMPAVVALHDAGNTVDGMQEVTQLDRAAARHGFAAVFPAATTEAKRTWNAGFCCGAGPSAGVDDMAFLDAVLEELAAEERIDADRVHLAGVSNGAVMAYRYACARADRVAGVGSVAGTMNPDTCQPSAPVPVVEIHGTADEVVPFEGGAMPDFVQATRPAMGAEALAARWAELNGCAGEPTVSGEPPVTRTRWQGCDAQAGVQLLAIEDAGHTWYAPEFGAVQGAVDATAEIVRFLGLNG